MCRPTPRTPRATPSNTTPTPPMPRPTMHSTPRATPSAASAAPTASTAPTKVDHPATPGPPPRPHRVHPGDTQVGTQLGRGLLDAVGRNSLCHCMQGPKPQTAEPAPKEAVDKVSASNMDAMD
jgi:hypothetical protein